ncbi:MAG: 2-methylcitrate dehydratase, partial [Candidatus Nanopelagicaceae bacterium]
LKDGSKLDEVAIEYPIGHKRRRADGIPLLIQKYRTNLARIYSKEKQEAILDLTLNYEKLSATPVDELMALLVSDSGGIRG